MTPRASVPFPRAYWVLPERLLAGYYPGDRTRELAEPKLAALLAFGIRSVVNLTEEGESGFDGLPFVPYADWLTELAERGHLRVACRRFPIRDVTAPSRSLARSILDVVDASLAEERPVYVHCRGGIGRTGSIVGCWLVRHALAQPDTAIERIRELRRADPKRELEFPQCDAQEMLVTSWRRGE